MLVAAVGSSIMNNPGSRRREPPGEAETNGGYDRRQFVALGAGIGTALLAGCATSTDPTPIETSGASTDVATGSTATTGHFRLLVSDQPSAIGVFERLDVSLDRARVFPASEGEGNNEGSGDENEPEQNPDTETATETEDATDVDGQEGQGDAGGDETDAERGEEGQSSEDDGDPREEEQDDQGKEGKADEDQEGAEESSDDAGEGREQEQDDQDSPENGDGGFFEIGLDGASVDLTEVVGEKAIAVFDGNLPTGRYAKIELHVAGVEGIVDGSRAPVKVPSEKLQIVKPFEVNADEPLEFVFDITVVTKGQTGEYNLLPVISESGIAGKDVAVDEVDPQEVGEPEDLDEGNQTSGDPPDDADDP